MKPDKHFASAAVILIGTACLIALTWVATIQAIRVQRIETISRTTAMLANQALTFTEQINRQMLGFDQTLRILVTAWEANPSTFDLEAWRRQTFVLDGLSRDMVLTDANGIIRQSSIVEAINQNASALDYFRVLSDPSESDDRLYIGPAAIDGIMRQWHMNVARALHHPDGSFAGVIDADYRIAAITDVFSQTNIGNDTFIALAGLEDGKLRGAVSATAIDPDANISETSMFAAIAGTDSGIWTGPSANDAVRRIHAFRRIPGRKFAVVVAVSEDEVLRSIKIWRRGSELSGGLITALLTGLAILLIQVSKMARRRRAQAADARAALAASNARFEVARALAMAKTEQLETTLAGMSDGVLMVDSHLCLVEWNVRFPEVAGIQADILRVGLPMEEILRAQIRSGQSRPVEDIARPVEDIAPPVEDIESEVAHRMAHLRSDPDVVRQQRPDGHTLELRRNRLPDGGFVTVYADITKHELAEEALRQARTAVATANAEQAGFLAMISHEIRTPLNALQSAIQLLADSVLVPAQRSLLTIARQANDALTRLVGDALDISQMEAGKLTIRPSPFQLRPLLDGCTEMLAGHAAEARHSIRVAVADDTPVTLIADSARVRQVLLNLLSNAMKFAHPGEIWLLAEPGRDASEAVRLTVTDNGPAIAPEKRDYLFPPPGQPATGQSAQPAPGLSICRHLIAKMGGEIGCEVRQFENGVEGNAFWITLPGTALPNDTEAADLVLELEAPPSSLPRHALPRTRILLSGDMLASQVVTAKLLRRDGHHVDVASNGPATIEAMRSIPYDLVLMDIFMPGLDGKAVEAIRALPEPARSTPIIALTNNAETQNSPTAAPVGTNGILTKPGSLTELREVLDHHVWTKPISAADAVASTDLDGEQAAVPSVLSTRRINELRAAIPTATLISAVEECLVDMDRRLPGLRRSLAARAPGAVTAHAQAMIGMATAYGMTNLEIRLRTIAAAAREGDLMSLGSAMVADLDRDFEQAAQSLREILRTEMA